MLVDYVARDVKVQQLQVVMINEHAGLKEVADDIHKGIIRIAQYQVIVLAIRRADVTRGKDFKKGLNKLIHALCTFGKRSRFIFMGPLPEYRDDKYVVCDLMQAGTMVKHRIKQLPGFKFCNASVWFADRHGIVTKYIGRTGLTTQGFNIFRQRLLPLL